MSTLLEYGYAVSDLDLEEDHFEAAFSSTMNRVFARCLGHAGDPVWLGIVEVIEPGSSAWLDVFGDTVVCLESGANWWPGTERLSFGDTRVRAIPAEAFGWDWQRLRELVGEGLYPAFDPFLFRRLPGGDLCHLETVGHEGIASCRVPEDDSATGLWLESLGFSCADEPWQAPIEGGAHRLCGARSRAELVDIFGEELVASLDEKVRKNNPA